MRINKGFSKQRIQIGSSSLLLVFTVLCLVVFSTLSLSSAKADYSLAIKNEQSVKSYYEVDSKGEELKSQINNQLIYLSAKAYNEKEFKELVKQKFKESYNEKDNTISYTIESSFEQYLFIQLLLCEYEEMNEGQENYSIICWAIKNKVDYEVDNNMPVWNGI